MLLSEASIRFLTWARSVRNLTAPTIRAYSGDLRTLIVDLGDRSTESIGVDELRAYFSRLSTEKNYAPATVRRRLATARVFFRFLEEDGVLQVSPTLGLRGRFEIPRRLPKVMSYREISRLLHAVHRYADEPGVSGRVAASSAQSSNLPAGLRDLTILEVLFSTGMRIGELVSLNLSDVSLPEGAIRVFGKGRRERTTFVANQDALETLQLYVRLRRAQACDQDPLFLNSIRQRMSIYSVEFLFKKYARRARIGRRFTPHCLRHTMATMLLENGADIRVVQEILGHRTIATTQIYTEVAGNQKRRALAKFGGRNRLHLRRREWTETRTILPVDGAAIVV